MERVEKLGRHSSFLDSVASEEGGHQKCSLRRKRAPKVYPQKKEGIKSVA
jgi:hypothetical protein